MKRKFKEFIKKLLHSLFILAQKLGINILPSHFYSQIPNISALKKEQYWRAPMSMHGINGSNIDTQLLFLKDLCEHDYIRETGTGKIQTEAIKENGEDGGYGVIEADVLYLFIRSKKPNKIIQVGCGVSTSIILKAAADAGYVPEIICVEPYPMPFLENLNNTGKIKLVQEKAQLTSLNILTALSANDLFFIDSTHTVKTGSEVNRMILEVLPRLKPGVWVHFHDINFPYDYRPDILTDDLFFWGETTMLYAFLLNNPHYEIKLSMSMLHYQKQNEAKKLLSGYQPKKNQDGLFAPGGEHYPNSIFLQTF